MSAASPPQGAGDGENGRHGLDQGLPDEVVRVGQEAVAELAEEGLQGDAVGKGDPAPIELDKKAQRKAELEAKKAALAAKKAALEAEKAAKKAKK